MPILNLPRTRINRHQQRTAPTLSKLERTVLTFYIQHQHRRLSVWTLIARYLPTWLIMFLAVVAVLLLLAWLIGNFHMLQDLAGIVIGLLVGAVIRDLAHIRLNVRFWPTLVQILDWSKVEEKLESSG